MRHASASVAFVSVASASVLVAPLAILCLFASALVGTDRIGFRDVTHFYTPLYDYVAHRQSTEWLPLWNPLDHTGLPLVGETTTAVWYPVRILVYSLPIESDVAMAWYVVLHLIVASLTAWTAARWSGISAVASAIAAVAYTMSGSVLFLYTNPPFLVGAAWMPLVFGSLLGNHFTPNGPARRDSMRIIVASLATSMMILGGDPQTGLHALITVFAIWGIGRIRRSHQAVSLPTIVATSLLAAGLAAPQIAASIDWSRQSDRVQRDGFLQSWFSPPLVGSRRHEAFQYSVPPWHAIEMVTPSAFGNLFPTNHRISQLLPGDGRMWTPTLYMGMLVALALAVRLARLRWDGIDAWTGAALLALTLAMGQFGIAWWIQATTGMLGTGMLGTWDSAVGGPYWCLYHLLPGYDSFRFPAKWLSIFAFAVAIVTAQVVDQESERQRLGKVAVVVLALLAIATITTWLGSAAYSLVGPEESGKSVRDEFWGPLDIRAALNQTMLSFIHSCLVTAAIAWLLWRKRSLWTAQRIVWSLLILLAVDATIAARALVLRVPRSVEQRLLKEYGPITDSAQRRWMRTQSTGSWPRIWADTESDLRVLEVEASQRAAWFGRWHLADRQAVFNNMVSIRSQRVAHFWEATRLLEREMAPTQRIEFWRSMRRWLDIDGVIQVTQRVHDVTLDEVRYEMVDRHVRHETVGDAVRAHQQWRVIEAVPSNANDFASRLHEIASTGGDPIPAIHVRRGRSLPNISTTPNTNLREASSASIAAVDQTSGNRTPDRAEFEFEIDTPTLLTRCVFQDGNWHALISSDGEASWSEVAVHAVDYLQQGVVLPPGKHRVVFRYQPWWLRGSFALAIAGWLTVGWQCAAWAKANGYLPMQNRLKTRSRMSSV